MNGERTRKGAELYREGVAPWLMLSDGTKSDWHMKRSAYVFGKVYQGSGIDCTIEACPAIGATSTHGGRTGRSSRWCFPSGQRR